MTFVFRLIPYIGLLLLLLTVFLPIQEVQLLSIPYRNLFGRMVYPGARTFKNYLIDEPRSFYFLVIHTISVLCLFFSFNRWITTIGMIASVLNLPMMFLIYLIFWFDVSLSSEVKHLYFDSGFYTLLFLTIFLLFGSFINWWRVRKK